MSEVIRGGAQAQTEATDHSPKFTPGPWRWDRFGDVECIKTGSAVATTDRTTPQDLANAALIAAAPDLYLALSDLLPDKLCGESWDLSDDETVQIVITFGQLRAARAALRKAEGDRA